MEGKLKFSDWVNKYFYKDEDHSYYTWTFTDDGMHPDDKTRWEDGDLTDEYDRYFANSDKSYIGIEEYEE